MTDAEKIKNEFDLSLLSKNASSIKKLQLAFEAFRDSLFSSVYPVGSIYMSVNSTSPATLFGGSWSRIQGRFLLAANDSQTAYNAGKTGGTITHTHTTADHALTVKEMAVHTHNINFTGSSSSGGTAHYLYASGLSKIYASSARNTITSDSSGVGNAHNHGTTDSASNMPPYLCVYVWKRTA